MGRRAGLEGAVAGFLLVLCFLLAGPAAGDPGSDKARVDAELGQPARTGLRRGTARRRPDGGAQRRRGSRP